MRARLSLIDPDDHYYRPRFKDPELRKHLMMMPGPMRGSSHFGDDVINETDASAFLLENTLTVTSEVGNMALFDGARLIHRGSLVKQGERFAMQIVFHPKEKTQELRSIKSLVRRLLNGLKFAISAR